MSALFDRDTTLTAIRYRIDDLSQPYNVGDPQLDSVVRSALNRHTQVLPASLVGEFLGSGSGVSYYALLTALPSWLEGLSAIRSISYPAVTIASDDPPPLLEPADWSIEEVLVSSARTLYLYFPNHSPNSAETVRVSYSGLHTISGLDAATATSVLSAHQEPFYDLCASLALTIMAAHQARVSQPMVSADVVNYDGVTLRLRQLAGDYMKSYEMALGLDAAAGTLPESNFVDWDTAFSWGSDWLFHQRRNR